MRTRTMRIVETEEPLGLVGLDDDGQPFFDDRPADVLSGWRRRAGDDMAFVEQLLAEGWSNGYLYLAPES